jgi:hypothetical protein
MAKQDPLVTAADELERAVGGASPDPARAERALDAAERALMQRRPALSPADGRVVEVDRPRLPSPGVDRAVTGLRKDVGALLEQTRALRYHGREVSGAAPLGDPAALAGALPVAPESGAAVDRADFVLRSRELATGLRQFVEAEAHVVLDAVNTDIGAGD